MEARKKLIQEFERIATDDAETVQDILSKELQQFTVDQLLSEVPLVTRSGALLPEWKRRVMASRAAERRNQEQHQLRQRQLDAAGKKEWWKNELLEKRKRGVSVNDEPPLKTLSRPIRKDRSLESDTNSQNNSISRRDHPQAYGTTQATWANVRARNSSVNAVVKSRSPINAVVKSSASINAVVKSSTPINAVGKSSTPINAVVKSSTPINAVVKFSKPINAVVKSSAPINAEVKISPPINAMVKSSWCPNTVTTSSTPTNAVAKSNWPTNAVAKSSWPVSAGGTITTPINAVVKFNSPSNTASESNTHFNALVKKKSLQHLQGGKGIKPPSQHPSVGKSVSLNPLWKSNQPPLHSRNAYPQRSLEADNRLSAETFHSAGYEEHGRNPSEFGYSSSEGGYEEDEGLYDGEDYSDYDEEDKLFDTFVKPKANGKPSNPRHGSSEDAHQRRPGRSYRPVPQPQRESNVPPAPPMPSGDLTMMRNHRRSDGNAGEDEEVQLRPPKKKHIPEDAERHPHVNLSVLLSVNLRKTENKFLGGEGQEDKDEEEPEREAASSSLTRQQAVVAELKETVEPDTPSSFMKHKVILKQKKKEEELLQVDITPEGMLKTIPLVDGSGTPIPEWRRQMMARKAAQKAASELLEQKIKELELMKLPAWKRHKIETMKN